MVLWHDHSAPPKKQYRVKVHLALPGLRPPFLEIIMDTSLTLGQMLHYKLYGFVQLDLFPRELELARRVPDESLWLDL